MGRTIIPPSARVVYMSFPPSLSPPTDPLHLLCLLVACSDYMHVNSSCSNAKSQDLARIVVVPQLVAMTTELLAEHKLPRLVSELPLWRAPRRSWL
jgi:hypothetical protein